MNSFKNYFDIDSMFLYSADEPQKKGLPPPFRSSSPSIAFSLILPPVMQLIPVPLPSLVPETNPYRPCPSKEERVQGKFNHRVKGVLPIFRGNVFAGEDRITDGEERKRLDASQPGECIQLGTLHLDRERPRFHRKSVLLFRLFIIELVTGEHCPHYRFQVELLRRSNRFFQENVGGGRGELIQTEATEIHSAVTVGGLGDQDIAKVQLLAHRSARSNPNQAFRPVGVDELMGVNRKGGHPHSGPLDTDAVSIPQSGISVHSPDRVVVNEIR